MDLGRNRKRLDSCFVHGAHLFAIGEDDAKDREIERALERNSSHPSSQSVHGQCCITPKMRCVIRGKKFSLSAALSEMPR